MKRFAAKARKNRRRASSRFDPMNLGVRNTDQPRCQYLRVGGRLSHIAYRYVMPNVANNVAKVYPTSAASKWFRFRDPSTINAPSSAVATTPQADAIRLSGDGLVMRVI